MFFGMTLALRRELCDRVRLAFGTPVSINRAAQSLQLLIGEPADNLGLPPNRDVLDDLLSRPPLDNANAGDGIRSFAGALMRFGSNRENLYLIDEPEAFLHPPQARMMGRAIAQMTPPNSQVFVATHSADIVEGILNAVSQRDVATLRLSRSFNGTRGAASVSLTEAVETLWADPLVRASCALDGLFTTATVVCEGVIATSVSTKR